MQMLHHEACTFINHPELLRTCARDQRLCIETMNRLHVRCLHLPEQLHTILISENGAGMPVLPILHKYQPIPLTIIHCCIYIYIQTNTKDIAVQE